MKCYGKTVVTQIELFKVPEFRQNDKETTTTRKSKRKRNSEPTFSADQGDRASPHP